jgi:hypothetical protein
MITGPADLRDQEWLEAKVALLDSGVEAAKEIWTNWAEGRCVGRLYPDLSCGDFLAQRLGGLRLDVGELVKALPEMSTREIAKVAGVDHSTVVRQRAGAFAPPDAEPTRVVGADGKSYPGRVVREVVAEVIEPDETPVVTFPIGQVLSLESLIDSSPARVAAEIYKSRVSSTRASLKRIHAWMGAVITELDKR